MSAHGVNKGIPLSQLVRWKLEGLTVTQIARQVGCSKANVSRRLTGHWAQLDGDQLSAYREHRVSLFTSAERAALTEIVNPKRLKSASLRDLTIAFGTIYDKGRLETGQSTANVALHALVESIERERIALPVAGEATRA